LRHLEIVIFIQRIAGEEYNTVQLTGKNIVECNRVILIFFFYPFLVHKL